MKWDDLDFWKSKHWQRAEEKLDDLERRGIKYNPSREHLFRGFTYAPFDLTKVVILGQDPYPNPVHASGLAFSVLPSCKELPPTLRNMFSELVSDLGVEYPVTGDLTNWTRQGVLLWNTYLTCQAFKPASHRWDEWIELTLEVITKLDKRDEPVLFVFLGRMAQEFEPYVTESDIICTSHPSPLGVRHGFFGSRLFSSINAKLAESGSGSIDWRL